MIARIERVNGSNRCSNCKMRQKVIQPSCPFCSCIFSNYEKVLIEFWEAQDLTSIPDYDIIKEREGKETSYE